MKKSELSWVESLFLVLEKYKLGAWKTWFISYRQIKFKLKFKEKNLQNRKWSLMKK